MEIDDFIHGDVRKQFLPDKVKMERHRKSFLEAKPVVFCVRCGSTIVDQNSPNELRCYECGTTEKWNSSKFSIRRGIEDFGEHDVAMAFKWAASRKHKNGSK